MNESDYLDDDVDDALDANMLARLAGGDAPEMDIDAYRLLVSDVAPPIDSQIDAFADYVAATHSWYKHLPMQPPGAEFHFYIDPNAGMDHLLHASGEVTVRARTPDTESFHYSWMTTADYRERFGYLTFPAQRDPAFSAANSGRWNPLPDGACSSARHRKPSGDGACIAEAENPRGSRRQGRDLGLDQGVVGPSARQGGGGQD